MFFLFSPYEKKNLCNQENGLTLLRTPLKNIGGTSKKLVTSQAALSVIEMEVKYSLCLCTYYILLTHSFLVLFSVKAVNKIKCMRSLQVTDLMFLFPLIGVILLLRWLISDGGARSSISAKFHATSSYNERVGS